MKTLSEKKEVKPQYLQLNKDSEIYWGEDVREAIKKQEEYSVSCMCKCCEQNLIQNRNSYGEGLL